MHIAAANGLSTSVEILLNKGADIWLKNNRNKTALLACARDDQVAECLELMLGQLIVSVSATTNQNGNTPLTPANNKQNQTYTPLKPQGLIRSSNNNTPRTGERNGLNPHLYHLHHMRPSIVAPTQTMSSNSTSTTSGIGVSTVVNGGGGGQTSSADSSLLTASDIILNDVHLNPLDHQNLTFSNGSLNNLNSTLINNNDEEASGNDDSSRDASMSAVSSTHDDDRPVGMTIDLNEFKNRSFEVSSCNGGQSIAIGVSPIEISSSIDSEFY